MKKNSKGWEGVGVKSLVGQTPLVLNDTEEDSWGIGVRLREPRCDGHLFPPHVHLFAIAKVRNSWFNDDPCQPCGVPFSISLTPPTPSRPSQHPPHRVSWRP